MVIEKPLEGKYVRLRSAEISDAEFTLGIRQDPKLTKYLPRLDISLNDQINWLKSQRKKEGDYFFVIERINGERIGTVSLYDIQGNIGETGRIATRGNAIESFEAQLLSFQYAFYELGLDLLNSETHLENTGAFNFEKAFGTEFGAPEVLPNNLHICHGKLTKESFFASEKKVKLMIYRRNYSE